MNETIDTQPENFSELQNYYALYGKKKKKIRLL
jgi:hypothetical protein